MDVDGYTVEELSRLYELFIDECHHKGKQDTNLKEFVLWLKQR